jgi:succinate dehydrogenase / fumarate reductase membrane anchor subunit
MTSKDFRTELAKAKGLGSAKHGMRHWLMQRVTGLIISICVVWIFIFGKNIFGKSSSDIVLILQRPENVIPLIILIISGFYHAALGMQVVIEDYVPNLCMRYALIMFIKLFSILTVVSSLCAIIYVMVL